MVIFNFYDFFAKKCTKKMCTPRSIDLRKVKIYATWGKCCRLGNVQDLYSMLQVNFYIHGTNPAWRIITLSTVLFDTTICNRLVSTNTYFRRDTTTFNTHRDADKSEPCDCRFLCCRRSRKKNSRRIAASCASTSKKKI